MTLNQEFDEQFKHSEYCNEKRFNKRLHLNKFNGCYCGFKKHKQFLLFKAKEERDKQRARCKKEKIKTAEVNYEAGRLSLIKEIMDLLPEEKKHKNNKTLLTCVDEECGINHQKMITFNNCLKEIKDILHETSN